MDENLKNLAAKLGIATAFQDAGMNRRDYVVSEEIIRTLAKRLGFKADNEIDIRKALNDLDKRRWQQALDNIYVTVAGEVKFDVIVPVLSDIYTSELKLKNRAFNGDFAVGYEISDTGDRHLIGKTEYARYEVRLTSEIDAGYYDILFSLNEKKYTAILAVAPRVCYTEPELEEGRLWGFNVQLYALKSERNWGVGDFTDLAELARICGDVGADVIGLNPLNVLVHQYPENASPYASISRLFLNPIYIDVEAVPEFLPSDKAEFANEIEELRHASLIDYTGVYKLKIKILDRLYQRLIEGPDRERQVDFIHYCRDKGEDMDRLAVFTVLYDEYCTDKYCSWKKWDEIHSDANPVFLQKYSFDNHYRVNFFKYLQFEAERQFNRAQEAVRDAHLKIGFYRDLPVGVSQDSAEVWGDQSLFVKDSGVGAPPDAFFPSGQNWNLGAFNPYVLKERGYEPFIKILRANMQNAGALRIDHVMSLMRLFIAPNGKDGGTYLAYNFHDMLNIVVLESFLNRCTIVGESIGNVPEGFLEALHERDIYSLSVLWAERLNAGWGDFKSPYDYPVHAFTSTGTHDMAPLKMWWFGYDIELSRSVGIITNDDEKHQAYKQREKDRWKLLFALDSNGVWPEDKPRQGDYLYGESYPEGIEEAVHRFISRSPSKVFLAQLEDVFQVDSRQNLPGVDRDKHPNWRRKLLVNLEKFESDERFLRNVAAIKKER